MPWVNRFNLAQHDLLHPFLLRSACAFPREPKTIHKISWRKPLGLAKDVKKCSFSDCALPFPTSLSLLSVFVEIKCLSLPIRTHLNQDYHHSELDLIQSSQALHTKVAFVIQAADLYVVNVHTLGCLLLHFCHFYWQSSVSVYSLVWAAKVRVYGYEGVSVDRTTTQKQMDIHTQAHTVARWWQTWLTPWPLLLWFLSSCFLLTIWC